MNVERREQKTEHVVSRDKFTQTANRSTVCCGNARNAGENGESARASELEKEDG